MKNLTIEEAKEFLEKEGYYVGNLWHIHDVQGKFKCSDAEAQEVLNGALNNEATIEQIWYAIDVHGENDGLERIEDEE